MNDDEGALRIGEVCVCWNSDTKAVGVLPWPIDPVAFQGQGYRSDYGASSATYSSKSTDQQAALMLAEGLYLIHRYGLEVEAVVDALSGIDELRPLLVRSSE